MTASRRTRPTGACPAAGNRRRPYGQDVWLTGLSGAGKSTLARFVEAALQRRGCPVCVLDGDVRRAMYEPPLRPDLELRTDLLSISACGNRILERLGIQPPRGPALASNLPEVT